MKKNIVLTFTKVIYGIFIIATIIILFMVYKGVNNRFAFKFGVGYILLVLFMLVYTPLITILNFRNFKWIDIRKRLFRFVAIFILVGTLNYILNYVFRPSKIDLFRVFSNALGTAFAIAFIDVTFFRKKDN